MGMFDGTYMAISWISTIAAMIVSGILANKKSRSVVGWVIGAFFLGWIGVIIVACLSDKSYANYVPPSYQQPYQQPYQQQQGAPYGIRKACPKCGNLMQGNRCSMCGHKE